MVDLDLVVGEIEDLDNGEMAIFQILISQMYTCDAQREYQKPS